MSNIIVPAVYGELVEYLARYASPQEIIDFKISSEAQSRADELLERNTAGTITVEEKYELEQMLHFDGLVSALKAEALEQLNS